MFKKLFSLFAALTLSVGLWAQGSVFTYTATEKLEEQFSMLGTVATHDFNDGVGTVTYSSTITTIEERVFISCQALQSITLPATLTTIGYNAFFNCQALQSITLPATLTTIGYYAFGGCYTLQSITLPATLTTIEEHAFDDCYSLESVTCKAIVPPTCGDGAFGNASCPLYVPAASVDAYQAANVWSDFDIQALPAPAETYTRDNLSNGKFGTICLAYAVDDLEGVDATFYQLNYFDKSASALYLEEVDALTAGMPYIFEAKAESFTVNLTITDEPAAANHYNGLYGALSEVVMTSDATHSYAAISNNKVNIAENGYNVNVAANRAYIDMKAVSPTELAHSAPLRVMGVPRSTPTNNENVNADGNMNGKFIINGQFVIVKDGKKINALGF